MEQFSIFYFFITLIIGFGLLSVSFYIYIKQNKNALLKKYLFFYSAFFVLSFLNLFSDYYKFNIIERNRDLYIFLRYLENPVFLLIVMYAVTIFIHEFVSIENKSTKNKIIGILTIVLLVLNYSISLFPNIFKSDTIRIILKDSVFILVLFYNFFILLNSYLREKKTEIRRKLFKLVIIFTISLPLIISDTFLLELVRFKLFPIVYILVGGYFLFYFINLKSEVLTQGIEKGEIVKILQNKYLLTDREIEVSLLIIEGASYKEIADKLFISVNTVKTHLQNIYQKTDSSNKMQLINKLTK